MRRSTAGRGRGKGKGPRKSSFQARKVPSRLRTLNRGQHQSSSSSSTTLLLGLWPKDGGGRRAPGNAPAILAVNTKHFYDDSKTFNLVFWALLVADVDPCLPGRPAKSKKSEKGETGREQPLVKVLASLISVLIAQIYIMVHPSWWRC